MVDSEAAEGRHQEDTGPARPPGGGFWAGTKRFLSKGSARWSVLVGVALLVGTVGVVYQNPGTVSKLRQQLLLHNAPEAGSKTQALRRSLSGTDPVHRAWDDVKKMKNRPQQLATVDVNSAVHNADPTARGTGDSFSQFLAATSRSSKRLQSAGDTGSVSACATQCSANGYSAAVAGATAAKACVDVCLEEKGVTGPAVRSHVHSSSSVAGSNNDHEDAAKRLLARVRAQIPGGPKGHASKQLPGDLAGIVSALGVHSSVLPIAEKAQLKTALRMDASLAAREGKDRALLKQSWETAVSKMRNLDAARLENAKSLSKAASRAVSENSATMSLDASVLMAATKFQQNLGKAARASAMPVNAPAAEKQLESLRSAQKGVEQAAQFSGEILADEQMKWKNGDRLVDTQLNAAKFVDPGSDVESKFWSAVLNDADLMPKADANKVRLAAMSDGKLVAMQRRNYKQARERMQSLGTDVRDMQAARVANAKLLADHMAKMAAQKQADTQLLTAEARYRSTVKQFGGKSKIADKASALTAKILKDAQQARALQLAAQAGASLEDRYGESVSSSAAAEKAMSALSQSSKQEGASASADPSPDAVGSASSVRTISHANHEVHRRKRASMSGKQAVASAAEGWFSPY